MTERPPRQQPSFFRPITNRAVAQALGPSLLWSYVSIVVGAVLLAAVGVLTLVVQGAWSLFDSGRDVFELTLSAVGTAAWIAGPVALAAAVWAAAYASTQDRSLPRSALGSVAALAVGAGLLALGASGFGVAALAVGWAVAIPAHSLGRTGVRGLVPAIAALAATTWAVGRIETLATWQVMLVVVLSPLAAAAWVWVSDALWMAARAARNGPR